jgi:hypothetical protein
MNATLKNSANNPEPTPEDRTLENIVMAIDRGRSLLAIVGDFANAALEKLDVLRISELANPDILTVMDLYDRPLDEEVRNLLTRNNIQFTETKVNDREAYSLRNLGLSIGKLPSGSSVELLTHQDRVVGIRVVGEPKQ